MNKTSLWLSAMLLGGVLHAEDTTGFSFKIRAQGGTETNYGVRNGFGAGLNYGFKAGPGILNAEFSYQYYSGKQYRQPIDPSNPFHLTDATAVDSHKSPVNGLGIRASYEMPISGSWKWHLGAAFMQMKSKDEAVGTFGTNTTTLNYGSWAFTPEKSALAVSPFAGVIYNLGDMGAIVINLIGTSYKQVTVTPIYNASAAGNQRVTPAVGDKSVNNIKLEVGYAFKF